ncbi:hypothetical protein H6F76_27120 [Leptolyngbya sp. FACHB-321]|nr:hypothetical protein [Leptolyngbya sp. FACHB-321]MBD2038630.1 hypothetical protein [Leptolyngbya sp. FACHB-321]
MLAYSKDDRLKVAAIAPALSKVAIANVVEGIKRISESCFFWQTTIAYR